MTKKSNFVHLHVHTEYSLLDGAIRVNSLFEKAAQLGMPAVAMTDHGNLFGAMDFYKTSKKYDIKPIIGCEIYLAPGSMLAQDDTPGQKRNYHLTLLAQNNTGFHNLTKIVSKAHLSGMRYGKPRADKDLLSSHSEGLICLSGCVSGEPNQFILQDKLEKAKKSIADFTDIFGKQNFFLEIQDNGYDHQATCTRQMLNFSKEFDLPLIATNDVHFLNKQDRDSHDVLICIGTGTKVTDESRMRYTTEVYFKPEEEMAKSFAEIPDAMQRTLEIAERCEVNFEIDPLSTAKYPKYNPPIEISIDDYFTNQCQEGLQHRYGEKAKNDKELQERLEYEIEIIKTKGFASYFLIVADFINWARSKKIAVGPGRGSAAGSLVAYSLGITDLCPIKYGLIFERFLNPERISPPDIDIDFCQNRRGEVLEYVRKKYGESSVSHIITFGRLGAKMVVRDVARVLGLSYAEGDRMAKMIPNDLGMTLEKAEQQNPEIKSALEADPRLADVWKYAKYLEGMKRGAGVHAAGIVIGDRKLDEHLPLSRAKEGEVVTQYEMEAVSDLGLLKMDFLGLKTLTVIEYAVDLIQKHTPDFDIEKISETDKKTFELLNRGETCGVFQLESGGMTNLCKKFHIEAIEDIIALIALYRPGPMDLIPDYIDRKKGKKKIHYLHPLLEEVSQDTFGIMIYQEQVIKAANLLAGYSMGDGDELRRAMGKKKPEIMAQERKKFVAGCKSKNNIPTEKANAIFDLLEKFAGYGFNKSHSAAYGVISYKTAYLKANFPVEFMAALLCNEINNTDKIAVFVEECQRMKIAILPPDINKSSLKFIPEVNGGEGKKKGIRFGLAAIKNVGVKAMQKAIAERQKNGDYTSLDDFLMRLEKKFANRKIVEALIKSGAFDFIGERRDDLFNKIDISMSAAESAQREKATGQMSLFGEEELAFKPKSVIDSENFALSGAEGFEKWDKEQELVFEKELLGFYVTGHPLDPYRGRLSNRKYQKLKNIAKLEANKEFKFAGLVSEVEIKYTKKNNQPFAIMKVEDFSDMVEVIAWPESYAKCSEKIGKNKVLRLTGRIDKYSEVPRLIITDVGVLKKDEKNGEKKAGSRGNLEEGKTYGGSSASSNSIKTSEIIETSKKTDLDSEAQANLQTNGYSEVEDENEASKVKLKEENTITSLSLKFYLDKVNGAEFNLAEKILRESPGNEPVKILLQSLDSEVKHLRSKSIFVKTSDDIINRLKGIPGLEIL